MFFESSSQFHTITANTDLTIIGTNSNFLGFNNNLALNEGRITIQNADIATEPIPGSGVENRGVITFNTGALLYGNGGYFKQTAGQLIFNGGTLDMLSPNGNAYFLGGTVSGTGTIIDGTVHNSTVFAPGFSPGAITITGDYSKPRPAGSTSKSPGRVPQTTTASSSPAPRRSTER